MQPRQIRYWLCVAAAALLANIVLLGVHMKFHFGFNINLWALGIFAAIMAVVIYLFSDGASPFKEGDEPDWL